MLCFDDEKERGKQFYFLTSFKDKIFMPYFKIFFHAKENYKLLNELFDVKLSMPCYDPIIAEWILKQQHSNIFQIKNNYCLKFNQQIDSFMKNMLCKSFQINTIESRKDFVNTVKFASFQSLIGISCFKQIKVSLQLESVWYYYAKIESEVVLIAAQAECEGFGLSEKDFEHQKELLIRFKKEIEIEIKKTINRDINLNCLKDVAFVLYDLLKLKPNDNKNSLNAKQRSTCKETLLYLSKQH